MLRLRCGGFDVVICDFFVSALAVWFSDCGLRVWLVCVWVLRCGGLWVVFGFVVLLVGLIFEFCCLVCRFG